MIQRTDTWYIYNEYEKLIREIEFIYQEYVNKISKLYDTAENEANKYEIYLENHPEEYNYLEKEEDILPKIQSLIFRRYNLIKNIKYRNLASYIIVLYHLIEQFLGMLIKQHISLKSNDIYYMESLKNNIKIIDKNKCFNNFNMTRIKEFYLMYDVNFNKFLGFNKIEELNLLDNTLKHGEGDSMNKLKAKRPDFFKELNNILYTTTLEDSLNLTENDFKEYIIAIKKFLNQLPKIMYYTYELK